MENVSRLFHLRLVVSKTNVVRWLEFVLGAQVPHDLSLLETFLPLPPFSLLKDI